LAGEPGESERRQGTALRGDHAGLVVAIRTTARPATRALQKRWIPHRPVGVKQSVTSVLPDVQNVSSITKNVMSEQDTNDISQDSVRMSAT
jgi:hypothetical protein